MLTQCLFLTFSELQVRVDGVGAMPRRLDAVDVVAREPARLARESPSTRPHAQVLRLPEEEGRGIAAPHQTQPH